MFFITPSYIYYPSFLKSLTNSFWKINAKYMNSPKGINIVRGDVGPTPIDCMGPILISDFFPLVIGEKPTFRKKL